MTQTKTCPRCNGSGWVPPASVMGARLSAMRRRKGLSGASVAFVMGVSRAYVNALELGHRPWTPELVARYKEALTLAGQTAPGRRAS